MKNYAEMSDFEINVEVAKASGLDVQYQSMRNDGRVLVVVKIDCGVERYYRVPDYCNAWADAGPVIDGIFSALTSAGKYDDGIGFGERDMTVWQAHMHHNKCGKLRAAMIVFLMMKDNETRILAPDEVSDE